MLQRVVDTGEGGDRVGRGAHMNATNHVADLLGAEAGVLVVNANLVGNEAVLNLIQWLPVSDRCWLSKREGYAQAECRGAQAVFALAGTRTLAGCPLICTASVTVPIRQRVCGEARQLSQRMSP